MLTVQSTEWRKGPNVRKRHLKMQPAQILSMLVVIEPQTAKCTFQFVVEAGHPNKNLAPINAFIPSSPPEREYRHHAFIVYMLGHHEHDCSSPHASGIGSVRA
jgi:hypothetical protein